MLGQRTLRITPCFAKVMVLAVLAGSLGSPALRSQLLRLERHEYAVVEGAGFFELCVLRRGRTDVRSSVEVSTVDGTATSSFAAGGVDFGPLRSGLVQFFNGEARVCFPVSIFDDNDVEGNEEFSVVLENALGAELESPDSARVTIIDDESIAGVDLQMRVVASPSEWKDAVTMNYLVEVSNVGSVLVEDVIARLEIRNDQNARAVVCAATNSGWRHSGGADHEARIRALGSGERVELRFCTTIDRDWIASRLGTHDTPHDWGVWTRYDVRAEGPDDVNPSNNEGSLSVVYQRSPCASDPHGDGCCVSTFLFCLFHPSEQGCMEAAGQNGRVGGLARALRPSRLVGLGVQAARFLANAGSLAELYGVRHRLAELPGGRQIVDLYYRHNAELTDLLLQDGALREQAIDGLDVWANVIRAFVDQEGTITIDAVQVAALEGFLDAVASVASPELRTAIERERQRLDVASLAGLDIEEAAARLRRLSCQSDDFTLCLGQGRYRVEARWSDFDGRPGKAHAVPLTDDTGSFWFIDSDNRELMIKVLDGRSINDHVWVFYGSLSNVDFTIDVTDTETGEHRRYHNPAGRFASIGDTLALSGSSLATRASSERAIVDTPGSTLVGSAASGPCTASATGLCLNRGRFLVEVDWRDFDGGSGQGFTRPLTDDTGTFWFFGPNNLELMVKVLDGRGINDHYWVFYGALSNVEFTLRVTDTATGAVRVYRNPAGRFESAGDTVAFAEGRSGIRAWRRR